MRRWRAFTTLSWRPIATSHGGPHAAAGGEQFRYQLRDRLFVHRAQDPYPFADRSFDLVISVNALHNLPVQECAAALAEVERVGRNKYLVVESYRTPEELFNLQCWALTCETFFRPESWAWLFERAGYTGDYEFIYFEPPAAA